MGLHVVRHRTGAATTPSGQHAIFLNGPIGTGKTTLGRALAGNLGGAFIDGDDHVDPDRPWYGSSLRMSLAVVEAGLAKLGQADVLVVAYPLRCINWIYFKRRFEGAGVRPVFVDLAASYADITAPGRARVFSASEQARIRAMIGEGYAARPFADLSVETGGAPFEAVLGDLVVAVARRIGR